MRKAPTLLVILDGFGYREDSQNNAIANAHTPTLRSWYEHYPHTLLQASGAAVGLPDGLPGNSEVGHMAIGAGRRIKQSITIIDEAIADGSFFTHQLLVPHLKHLQKTGCTLHLMGLLSDGGVHSYQEHLYAIIKAAHLYGVPSVCVHAFLDGRDVPPQSAATYLEQLERFIADYPEVHIASLHGRFYAMDRDKNWERTQVSYKVLTDRSSSGSHTWQQVLAEQYHQGLTDEFIIPTLLYPKGVVRNGDGIFFFNYRADRARQLTECFVNPAFNHFPVRHLELSCFITPTEYASYLPTDILFPMPTITHTLKGELASAGKTIFTIAETEKYAHVTYFFGGGTEKVFPGETRVLIPSIHAKTYQAYPRMSADAITDAVLASLTNDPCDFYLINYANADMVGHSGDFQATVRAVECLDEQLAKLYAVAVQQLHGTMYVTADHGNAEHMYNTELNQPCTSHTLNPVPFLVIKEGIARNENLPLHELADIAPYILHGFQLLVPAEMRDFR